MSKIIYKGQEYMSGSQYQELTQTEYNALSEAEKKNGTLYFVTDGVPGGGQDYVVEQGTSGIWTYRKWASGIAECWGTYSKQIAANTVDVNNYMTYPFTFISEPFITTGLQGGGADLYRGQVEPSQTNASQVRLVLINKHTAAVALYMGVHAIGKWK